MILPTVETDRLVLRDWREDDLDAYAAMTADPEVMRHIGDGHVYDRAEAWRGMAGMIGHAVLRGYSNWAVEERAGGGFVGRIGLYNPEGWPGLEVGWLLGRSSWGKGYATEGGRATVTWARERLGDAADDLISLIQVDNRRSIAVAERLGFGLQETITMQGRDVAVYGIHHAVTTLR